MKNNLTLLNYHKDHQVDKSVYYPVYPAVTALLEPARAGTPQRAERTPEEVVVSEYTGERPGAGKLSPGTPPTNLKPPVGGHACPPEKRGQAVELLDLPGQTPDGPRVPPRNLILDPTAERSKTGSRGFYRACPAGMMRGHCESGHNFAKEVYCNREWCPTCNGAWQKGQRMKPSHARRFAQWYSKVRQIDKMGCWTFTLPPEVRDQYRTKAALSELGQGIRHILQSHGYVRGLRRWHWFGDNSSEWHPHLNCIVDGGFVNKRALQAVRLDYSRLLGVKLAIAYYHFADTPEKKTHQLIYINRATFTNPEWDREMAMELRGFRNQLWWGSGLWNGPSVWALKDNEGNPDEDMSDEEAVMVAHLGEGICPKCGHPIVWDEYMRPGAIDGLGGRRIGRGYWVLPDERGPPPRMDFSGVKMTGKWRRLQQDGPPDDLVVPGISTEYDQKTGKRAHREAFAAYQRRSAEDGKGGDEYDGVLCCEDRTQTVILPDGTDQKSWTPPEQGQNPLAAKRLRFPPGLFEKIGAEP